MMQVSCIISVGGHFHELDLGTGTHARTRDHRDLPRISSRSQLLVAVLMPEGRNKEFKFFLLVYTLLWMAGSVIFHSLHCK